MTKHIYKPAGREILRREMSGARAEAQADASGRTLSFIFANPGAIRGDDHQLKPGCWVSNWRGMGRDGLESYRRNPVVLEAHDLQGRAVAKCTSISEKGDGRLVGTVEFSNTPDGEQLLELYRSGVMSACSIQWSVLDATRSTDPNRRGGLDILRAELLEISLVSVPADENALVVGRSLAQRAERAHAAAVAIGRAPAFACLGEWALSVLRATTQHVTDSRLVRAPTGASEQDTSGGGFLVPVAFAKEIIGSIHEDRDSPLSYFAKFDIPDGANGLKLPGVDETSRANGYRWGGVLADFVGEGTLETASFPKAKQVEFDAKKLLGVCYVTSELFRDASNLSRFLTRAFSDELRFKAEQYCLGSSGTGVGKPLSILNSPALVVAAKTAAQTAGTLSGANLRTMLSLLPSASRKRAIWLLSESAIDVVDAADEVSFPQSGSTHPDDPPRIKGRPAIVSEALPTIGTQGDVLAIDPLWFGFASKPMISALSADVAFISDQIVFRLSWRIDAKPLVAASITCVDGISRSPFVALQAR